MAPVLIEFYIAVLLSDEHAISQPLCWTDSLHHSSLQATIPYIMLSANPHYSNSQSSPQVFGTNTSHVKSPGGQGASGHTVGDNWFSEVCLDQTILIEPLDGTKTAFRIACLESGLKPTTSVRYIIECQENDTKLQRAVIRKYYARRLKDKMKSILVPLNHYRYPLR